MNALLDVIAVVSNPCRFESRYRLYKEFKERITKNPLVRLTTVELAYGEREHRISNANDIQLRTSDELWHKENLINIGLSRLPSDSKYVAWIDADIDFVRKDWACETIQRLQHYDVIQMFSHACDLGPEYETINLHKGFMYCYHQKMCGTSDYSYWHPGYAWSARKSSLDKLGGLMDFPILGSADHHMAHALIETVEKSIPSKINISYKEMCKEWELKCKQNIRRNVGYMPGTILHYWHGRKKDRKYKDRWNILIDNCYCPRKDVRRNTQGLFYLDPDKIELRDQIRQYFRERAEDCNINW